MLIRHAAIKLPNGKIYTGKSHSAIFNNNPVKKEANGERCEQGFMVELEVFTDEPLLFVTRKEAAYIAFEAGQITERVGMLMSEDIWAVNKWKYNEVKGYYKDKK